jgi:SHS2 domain-containing protein
MPFEELPHTADWALRVRAGSLAGLFSEAARGMNSLSGAQAVTGTRIRRTFAAEAPDPESLLVAFLSDLVYACEQEDLVFEEFQVEVEVPHLHVVMSGAPILSINKTIKAVTYHNLQIRKTGAGFQVEIVFDV